ncbi:MAG: MFS transporter [Candidatus Lokiarchaeota archaeon]|nr:MFS transporter [Candidatus Lokiarchaeota archaeon]MBD3340359.1 MFS transporter [Candidatus Lokiarchaeota archaeon]
MVLFQEYVENDKYFVSYYNAMIVLGWFLGAQLGGIFIEFFGIDNIFIFLLIISLINGGFTIFIREHRNLIRERFEEQSNSLLASEKSGGIDSKAPISKSIYGAMYFRNFGIRPIISVLAIIMAFHINSDIQIGFLIGINPLLQFFLILLFGRIINERNTKSFMVIGYCLSIIVILGYYVSVDFIGFLISQMLISFSFAMFFTATQIYISQLTTPDNKGKYVGYANSSFYLGSFSGGLYFSLLLAIYSDYYIAILFMVVFPGLSSLIIMLKFEGACKNNT